MNPPPQNAAQRAEPDADEGRASDRDDSSGGEFDRFTDLTRKLLTVPKQALAERRPKG